MIQSVHLLEHISWFLSVICYEMCAVALIVKLPLARVEMIPCMVLRVMTSLEAVMTQIAWKVSKAMILSTVAEHKEKQLLETTHSMVGRATIF
jgi:hypothetical protein